jgi:hypothetical protein
MTNLNSTQYLPVSRNLLPNATVRQLYDSFKEVSETTYALEVYIVDNNLMTVVVPENQAMDIAGNSNLASPILQVRHYTVPAVSVVMYSLTTAGLLTTALASAALSVSSASLAAAGALSSRTFGSIGADPSRNLLVSKAIRMLICVLTFCLLFSENLVELFLDDYKSSFHLPFAFGVSDI